MSTPEDVLYFQSVGIAEGKSFEEVRIQDYIQSYQTTGRPPQPVPQEPKDEAQRKAMNLPPLFQPYVDGKPTSAGALGTASVVGGPGGLQPLVKVAIMDPNSLPLGQEFRERTIQGEKYQSISTMAAYENFSHEELRYYAYARGHRNAPVPVLMVPFSLGAKLPGANGATQPPEDRLENISTQPGYDQHSPEEFRVAFLLFGRELTSAELMQIQNPQAIVQPPAMQLQPPPPMTTPAPVSMPALGAPPPALPQPIFSGASATGTPQSTPRFTFGLR
ncbi:hypothetical protein CVT26_001816 [Gymnopilus dilepis]|uniref:Uncharacterized protein n=1 Tax=Gymnopilus dilepis TaxID=231916 RepID=A0A409VRN0_9AGAR|nr:hypothetical protein CVT26_001816 [Gymnopilus dilepis]